MPIHKTEAVVLRRIRFSESSLILTMYTRDFGKIKALAKGALRPKSKFLGSLEQAEHISIVFYSKQTRDIQTLSHAELVHPFLTIRSNLRKTTAALAMLEQLDAAIIGEEGSPPIFEILVEGLNALDSGPGDQTHLWRFQLRLLSLIGYGLDIAMPAGRAGVGKISPKSQRILAALQRPRGVRDEAEEINELFSPSAKRASEINRFLGRYFAYHIEGIRQVRSVRFLESLS